MKSKKYLKTLVFAVLIVFGISGWVAAASSPLQIIVNGVNKTPKDGVYRYNGKTKVLANVTQNGELYVSAKMIASMLGIPYTYDTKKNTVSFGTVPPKTVNLTSLPVASIQKDGDAQVSVESTSSGKQLDIYTDTSNGGTTVEYAINGSYSKLNTSFMADSVDSAKVEVIGDNNILWDNDILAGYNQIPASINIKGVNSLKIRVTGIDEQNYNGYFECVNPVLVK